jgi:hypothetical protein
MTFNVQYYFHIYYFKIMHQHSSLKHVPLDIGLPLYIVLIICDLINNLSLSFSGTFGADYRDGP